VLEVMQSGFVLYERAMGLPPSVIVWKYILRSALTSTVTQIGLLFGILLAGAVVTETVFDWPGIGTYAVNSIIRSDYNAVMGFTVWAGTIFLAVNLLVDLAHTVVDPRERMS
jgi:peptide/nickel transport system permease protein